MVTVNWNGFRPADSEKSIRGTVPKIFFIALLVLGAYIVAGARGAFR
jgi:hypothetical protein